MPKRETTQGWLGGYEGISEYSGVSTRTVGRWIAEGKLRVQRLSARKVLCKPQEVDRCIRALADEHEMGSQS